MILEVLKITYGIRKYLLHSSTFYILVSEVAFERESEFGNTGEPSFASNIEDYEVEGN